MSKTKYYCLFILAVTGIVNITRAFNGGSGNIDDPYQVATTQHLISIGSNQELLDKHYIMTADVNMIDCFFDTAVIAPDMDHDNDGFQGISFEGTFNGNGHVIFNLNINTVSDSNSINGNNDYLGLFGSLESQSNVKNLGIENTVITGGQQSKKAGSLAGYSHGASITNCYSTGTVHADEQVGGLVGENRGYMENCFSTVSVTGRFNVGGLVGYSNGTVKCSRSTGNVNAASNVGGLIGSHSDGRVEECYSIGSVTGHSDIGGLIGMNKQAAVVNCYSAGPVSAIELYDCGGLIGENYMGQVIRSFWDIETSTVTASDGGTGLTTEQMQQPFYYSVYNWAGTTWTIDSGNDYPRLAWENIPGDFIADPDVTFAGSGTTGDPWIIESKEDLLIIGLGTYYWDKSYLLNTDIDLSGTTYHRAIIGHDRNHFFSGSLEGNGHIISGMTIIGSDNLGLFGYIGPGGSVSNLGVIDFDIPNSHQCVGLLAGAASEADIIKCYSEGHIVGNNYIGGLIGDSYNCNIKNCFSVGSVAGIHSSIGSIGGLVGHSENDKIENCYSTASVSGASNIGGLGGYLKSAVKNCYSTGDVTGNSFIGGLTGAGRGDITNCYSTSPVIGSHAVGGLVGVVGVSGRDVNFTNCYSTGSVSGDTYVGGLTGKGQANVHGCFWNVETSGQVASNQGIGKTTAEMKSISTFTDAGWDFDKNWWINRHRDYPRLSWQPFGDLNNDCHVNITDISIMSSSWLSTDTDPYFNSICELSGDNTIDIIDLTNLVDMWLEGPYFRN